MSATSLHRLPLYFERIKEDKVFVSSESGRWLIISNNEFEQAVANTDLHSTLKE